MPRHFAATVSLALAGVLSGCAAPDSTQPSSLPDGWSVVIQEAAENARSDFEREVLSDGVITQEEYDLANEAFMQCIERTYPPDGQLVVSLVKDSSGFYNLSVYGFTNPEGDPTVDGAVAACEDGTVATIAGLYYDMTINPERRDWTELVVECLLREDVVEPPYTGEDFSRDLASGVGQTPEFFACINDPRPSG